MVYFVQNSQGNIKIGATENIDQRLKSLQTGNSEQLRLLYIIETKEDKTFPMEKHTHEICQLYKLQGEWFKFECIEHLKRISVV